MVWRLDGTKERKAESMRTMVAATRRKRGRGWRWCAVLGYGVMQRAWAGKEWEMATSAMAVQMRMLLTTWSPRPRRSVSFSSKVGLGNYASQDKSGLHYNVNNFASSTIKIKLSNRFAIVTPSQTVPHHFLFLGFRGRRIAFSSICNPRSLSRMFYIPFSIDGSKR